MSDALKLHRIHAAPASGKGGRSFDLGPFRWRPDGGDEQDGQARAMAYRLAFTWNMAEGIPTTALENGCIADFYRDAMLLVARLEAGCSLEEAVGHARTVRAAYDCHQFDRTDGRLHDCEQCAEKTT